MPEQNEYMDYRITRKKQNRLAALTGAGLTVAVHVAVVVTACYSGMTYLDPPPPEQQSILIEFEDTEVEVEKPKQIWNGSKPRVKEPDRTRETELVQRSEAPFKGHKLNESQESVVDDFGDVEQNLPPEEKPIERRALFRATDNKSRKDTLSPQVAEMVSDRLKAGHAEGNTSTGKVSGEPNARLKGRSLNGTLPKPQYAVQQSGTVVVTIWVDQYGNVSRAIAGAEGTTVTDATLWAAARKAAMGAHFNQSADAPPLQQGTITYIFKLK